MPESIQRIGQKTVKPLFGAFLKISIRRNEGGTQPDLLMVADKGTK
ncbi:MAG TPA: hypothetical protein VKZ54_02520 [Membranihabitans sp.]|nr:hypothetical protein [Membranihabitans sp.]